MSKMTEVEKNIDKLSETLKKQEDTLRQKTNFCKEHNFKKEEEWLRMKCQIVQEIRFEVDLLKSSREFRPLFDF